MSGVKLLTRGEGFPKKGSEALVVYVDRLNDMIKELNSIIAGIGDPDSLDEVQINNLIAQQISGVGEDPLAIDGLLIKDNGFLQYRKPFIEINSNYVITNSDSNAMYVITVTGGVNITLGQSDTDLSLGAVHEFLCLQDLSSNNHVFSTEDTLESIFGTVRYYDRLNSTDYAIHVTDINRITMDGATQGGLRGTHLKITNVDNRYAFIEGTIIGNGAPGTIFTKV